MTKQKSTKRALLLSALSLLMCVSMLIGSTFAWFTDSVASGNNVIKSGKLDVKMSYLAPQTDTSSGRVWENFSYYYQYPDNAQWVDVESDKAQPIFNYDKWEPGYTDCAYLMIENEGNLNLKYCLNVVPTGEVGKLAEVIDVYYQVYYQATTKDKFGSYNKGDWLNADHKKANPDNIWYDNMTEGSKYAGTLQDVIDGKFTLANDQMLYPNGFTGKMFENKPQGRVYYAIALHMREDAGNEYQNQSIGDAFDVCLLATQAIGEQDMYSNDYDAKAEYPEGIEVSSVDELMKVVATNQTAIIVEDAVITLDDSVEIAHPIVGKAAIVNNGTLNITGGSYANGDTTNSSSAVIENHGVLNISGGEFGADGNSGRAVSNIGGTVTISGGTFSAFDRSVHTSRAAYVFASDGGTITIKDGTSIGAPNGIFYASNGGEIIVNGGTFTKGRAANNYYLAYANGGTIKLNGGTYVFESSDECIWPFYDSIDGLKYNTTTQIYLDESCTVNWDRTK